MFTGIIENIGKVNCIEELSGSKKMLIESILSNDLNPSDSIAVNGVCLTVVNVNKKSFEVDVIKETLNLTNLSKVEINHKVNLETCAKIGDRINGHIVTGHIEGIGKIISKETVNIQTDFTIKIDTQLLKYCIYKGSVCIDGISLTISDIDNESITVSIIPYTLINTILNYKNIGDLVNIETDIFAKYIEKILVGEKNDSK